MLLLSSTFTTSSCTPFITHPSFKTRTKQAHGFRVSCNAEDNENQFILPETQKLILPNNVDRRNLLVGLGGLYTAANVSSLPSALALPITTPDITSKSCGTATKEASKLKLDKLQRTLECCPTSLGKKIQPFKFPSNLEKTRERWPAHKGTDKQKESYKKAIQAIRDLPDDHPHSHVSQAKIHCAYCNDGYTQEVNGIKQTIHIHNSWLFFPFHRWYLYFYERILRKYSGDDDFALPYWNWDNPEGMKIPQIFVDALDGSGKPNPLYDEKRNPSHLPPEVVDLNFRGAKLKGNSKDEMIENNLCMLYRDMKTNASDAVSFFGGKYTAGTDNPSKPSVGSVEGNSHTAVHAWVGQARSHSPNGEDMGSFYSAGYDPLFYVHHANVDRMWKLWKDWGIAGHSEPKKADWLNASYVFYDENENLVRVYNEDSVNIDKLKYHFEHSDIHWKTSRPVKSKAGSEKISSALIGEEKTANEAFANPASVAPLLKVRVKRPKQAINRTPEQKEKEKETLFINGIQFNTNKPVKFDVYVNDRVNKDTTISELPTPCYPEFAGSFSQAPGGGNQGGMLTASGVRFGLNELLEDTKTEGLEYALVALVAREGCEDLTVTGIDIELVPAC